jgi:hypothetical protein
LFRLGLEYQGLAGVILAEAVEAGEAMTVANRPVEASDGARFPRRFWEEADKMVTRRER